MPAAPLVVERIVERRPDISDQINAVFAAISRVLAVRLQLLLSLLGAFALAVMAMQWQSSAGLWLLIAWCLLTVIPLVALEWAGRPRRQ